MERLHGAYVSERGTLVEIAPGRVANPCEPGAAHWAPDVAEAHEVSRTTGTPVEVA